MKFTDTKPTTPGAYWFKDSERGYPILVEIYERGESGKLEGRGSLYCGNFESWPGAWSSRLVPVDEVESAYKEGLDETRNWGLGQSEEMAYAFSRAKYVVEGVET